MTTQPLNPASLDSGPEGSIRRVKAMAPFGWLADGLRTFKAAPGYSLLYGALFALAGVGALALTRGLPWFAVAFLTGLLLIAQFLAAGLYAAARRHGEGEAISIAAALKLLGSRATNLALYALFLALVMAAWVRISALIFAIKFTFLSPSIDDLLGVLSREADPVVLGFFFLIGSVLVAAVYVTSAVAVPAIVDRNSGPITAIVLSAQAVNRNWPAMLLWALLITALTITGILTVFAAFVVIYPLLGYATWNSYRALVR